MNGYRVAAFDEAEIESEADLNCGLGVVVKWRRSYKRDSISPANLEVESWSDSPWSS